MGSKISDILHNFFYSEAAVPSHNKQAPTTKFAVSNAINHARFTFLITRCLPHTVLCNHIFAHLFDFDKERNAQKMP